RARGFKRVKFTMNDEEHLLHDIVHVAGTHTQPPRRPPNEVEVLAVHLFEAQHAERPSGLLSSRLAGVDGRRPRVGARRETSHVTNVLAGTAADCDRNARNRTHHRPLTRRGWLGTSRRRRTFFTVSPKPTTSWLRRQ